MTTLDELPFQYPSPATPTGAAGRKPCRKHEWVWVSDDPADGEKCRWCPRVRDAALVRQNRNNRKRGNSDELVVARILGGRKVGQLGLPWDVEVEGYARIQAKQLDRWPSLNEVVRWLDAIPAGPELRGVALADTPGPGRRTRRLLIVDLEEYAAWHGR